MSMLFSRVKVDQVRRETMQQNNPRYIRPYSNKLSLLALLFDCDSLSSGLTLPPCLLHRFVLRNHIAQKAIEMAEKGEYSEVSSSTYALRLACISLYKSCTP